MKELFRLKERRYNLHGIISICHQHQVIRSLQFHGFMMRREIVDKFRMIYGKKFNEMYFLISLDMSESLMTNQDGTNVSFGGRRGGRTTGFSKLSAEDILEINKTVSKKGLTTGQIALKYNVSGITITRIIAKNKHKDRCYEGL